MVGCFSAIIGVGGGIYIVPTLLKLKFIPQVVSATSLFLVFWAKLASTILFILNGSIKLDYMVVLSVLSLIGSYVSLKVLKNILKTIERQSIISYAFTIFVSVACLITLYEVIITFYNGPTHGNSIWSTSKYC